MAGSQVIGRAAELAAVESFLDAAARNPRALVLSGEAGMGKTLLWRAGVEAAQRRPCRVLTCRGVEAEASLSFAGLSELIGPVLDEASPYLAPARLRALEVALLLVEPGEMTRDMLAVGLAVLDLLRALASQGPIVVAIDDAQWLDPASAGVVQIALRRVHVEPVGVLATTRTGPGFAVPIDFERCFAPEQLDVLELAPLELGALHELLVERIALDLPRPALTRLQATARGNPFFALELAREQVRRGTRLGADRALRVPDNLRELLRDRLASLPTGTGDVLLTVAALARPSVELVSAVDGDHERVLHALDAAVEEGVVELDESRVGFTHPLHASICYQQAPPWKRRAVHRVLATVVTDLEERARHLALAAEGPDALVAAALDTAAESAAVRGATAAGAELCELAAELTPADPARARARRLRAATLHRLAGDRRRAIATLEELLAAVPSGVDRADVLLELAMVRGADGPAMIGFCDEALAEAVGDDVRTTRLLLVRSFARMFVGDIRRALVDAQAALDKAQRLDDPVFVAAAIARVGHAETYAAEVTPGLLERGAEIERRLGLELEYYESPGVALARHLVRLAEVDRARVVLEDLNARAMARGDEGTRGQLLWALTTVEWLAGRWTRSLEHAREAEELMSLTHEMHAPAMAGRIKALVEADLGLVAEARRTAEVGLAAAEALSDEFFAIASVGVLGRIELMVGELEAAGAHLRDLPRRLVALGINDPALPVWADTIETLIGLGDLGLARAYLEQYEAHTLRITSPWATAAASRCRGMLCAVEGDLARAVPLFEQTLATLDRLSCPFERARTLLAMGAVRRQAQQKGQARADLDRAIAIFDELGASAWAERARSELRRISGRRPSPDMLTETEHQIAVLAAEGLTNKRIASSLHMGVSTVEAHLSRVYSKLGIRRVELSAHFARSGGLTIKSREQPAQT